MKSKIVAMEKLETIQREKEALEAQMKAQKAEMNALEERLREAQEQVEREKKQRHVFPAGFSFSYNNRRGDPRYTCNWDLVLRDPSGKEVGRWCYSEDHYTEDKAKAAALDTAWKLYDIAEAISAHIRPEVGNAL